MKKVTIAAVAAFALARRPLRRPICRSKPSRWSRRSLRLGISRSVRRSPATTSSAASRSRTTSRRSRRTSSRATTSTRTVQLYAGLGGASIDFPNRAAARSTSTPASGRPSASSRSISASGTTGIRADSASTRPSPTAAPIAAGGGAVSLPNGNVIKKDLSFCEVYGKVNYTVNDNIALGAYVYYSPSVLNSGADGVFFGGTAKYTWAALSNGVQPYISGEVGHWSFGTTDALLRLHIAGRLPCQHPGIPLPDYTTWNVGIGWTWKVFTVDLRYIDTDLNKGDCNAFTGDHTATFGTANVTAINPAAIGSNWCGAPLRRPALGRPDGEHQPQVSLKPIPSRAAATGCRPFSLGSRSGIGADFAAAGARRTRKAVAVALERKPAAVERRERRAVADRDNGRIRQPLLRAAGRARPPKARRATPWPRRETGNRASAAARARCRGAAARRAKACGSSAPPRRAAAPAPAGRPR